jgi:hypothetical protein
MASCFRLHLPPTVQRFIQNISYFFYKLYLLVYFINMIDSRAVLLAHFACFLYISQLLSSS